MYNDEESVADEVDEASSSKPDTDERRDKLTETDTVGSLEHIEVL